MDRPRIREKITLRHRKLARVDRTLVRAGETVEPNT
jgi:hypothetical protein